MSDIDVLFKKKIYKKIYKKILAVLISLAMTELRVCIKCKRDENQVNIDDGRKECANCRTHERQKKESASYESYLNALFINAKSAVKRGARAQDHSWELVNADLPRMWELQKGRCAVSGVFLTHHKDGSGRKDFNASIDRISNTKSYSFENVQLVAYRINLMKHTLPEDMFYWWVKTINDFSCD